MLVVLLKTVGVRDASTRSLKANPGPRHDANSLDTLDFQAAFGLEALTERAMGEAMYGADQGGLCQRHCLLRLSKQLGSR